MDRRVSSSNEIAAAAAFVWERPAQTTMSPPPLRLGVIIALLLLVIAHAGFSFFAVWMLPWLFAARP